MLSKNSVRFIVLLSVAFLYACNSKPSAEALKQQIIDEFSKHKGTFAVAFKDLTSGQTLFINEHETFHAASTMKTPVMIEVFKQAEAGKFSLSDSVVLKNQFKSIVDSSNYSLHAEDDSEHKLYQQLGLKRTISALIYDMIIVSSNLATNIVIELVDAGNVTQTMRDLGAKDIQVLRGVEDSKAFEKGLNNSTTAYDLMVIFEKMAKGETVSSDASNAMINILLDQHFNEIIPAKLPEDVKVAHKTGSITGVQHDSGIVFLPDGRQYILVILSKELEDEKAAITTMADISERIYQYVTDLKEN